MWLAEEKGRGMLAPPHLHQEWSAKRFPMALVPNQQHPERAGSGREVHVCPSTPPFSGSLNPTSGREEDGETLEVAQNSKHEQLHHVSSPFPTPRTQEAGWGLSGTVHQNPHALILVLTWLRDGPPMGREKSSPKRQIKPRHFAKRPCLGLQPTKQKSYSEMKPNLSPSKLSLFSHFYSHPYPCKSKKLQAINSEREETSMKKKPSLKVLSKNQRHLPWAKNSLETHPKNKSLWDHSLPPPHQPTLPQRMKTRKHTHTPFKLSHCLWSFHTKLLSVSQLLSIQESFTMLGEGTL